MARSRSLPLNMAAVIPRLTPPAIHTTKADRASDSEIGKLSSIRSRTGLP